MLNVAPSLAGLSKIPKTAANHDLVQCCGRSIWDSCRVMNRLRIALVMILAVFLSARAFADSPAPWSGLVPKGFRVVETIRGDLNRDGRDDVVLLVKASDPDEVVTNGRGERVDRNRRGLVIAFRDRDRDGYQLVLKNPTLLSSENEEGGVYFPPELSVGVEKGALVLHYSHGRYGYWQYKFRYQQGQFVLIGYDRSEHRGPVIESVTSINFSTGKKLNKVNTNRGAQGGEERFVEQWSRIVVPKPIDLADISDLDNWSIEQALGER